MQSPVRGSLHAARIIVTLLTVALLCAGLRAQRVARSVTAAEVRAMPAAELAARLPVHLEGIVTFHEPQTGLTFLQDETAGVAIAAGVPSQLPPNIVPGTRLAVEGVPAAGAFAPVVTGADGAAPEVKVLGRGPLPVPLPLGLGELSRGLHDGRWVELHGIVRALVVRRFRSGVDEVSPESPDDDPAIATRLRIDLGTAAGRFTVIVPWVAGRAPPTQLGEARVRVRGVLGSITNNRRQWAGILVFVPDIEQIAVERPPTVDPFSLTPCETDEVMRFSPAAPEEDRVRVEGVVTLSQPGFRFFIRGRRGPLEVQTPHPQTNLQPGCQVDVVGYPALLGTRVVLQDAAFRVLARAAPPPPIPVTLSEALTRYRDSDLVSLSGRLSQVTLRGSSPVLLVESEGRLTEASLAQLPAPRRAEIEQLQAGSILRLTGIAIVQSNARWDGAVRSTGINLLLRTADDIAVLRKPPWWTPTVLLRMMAVLVALIGLGLVWVYLLRRRVEQQTAIIRRNFEREAIWEERSRIARDIHDDVGAALTQISLLGEFGRRAGTSDDDMRRQLTRVAAKSVEAVRALDEIVWTVNPHNDSVARASSYICQAVQDQLRDTTIRCRLHVPDDLPDGGLAAKVRHNLFLAVKEAVNNVIKHAAASELRLTLAVAGREFRVRIEDDGRGYDSGAVRPGRNGLDNMRRRLAEIGGCCTVATSPGSGTTVTLAVPATDAATSNEGWQAPPK